MRRGSVSERTSERAEATCKHPIEDRPARIHLFEKMLEFWKLYL